MLAFGTKRGEDNEKEFKTGNHSQEVEQGKSGRRVIFGFPLETNTASRDFSSETNKIPSWIKPDGMIIPLTC